MTCNPISSLGLEQAVSATLRVAGTFAKVLYPISSLVLLEVSISVVDLHHSKPAGVLLAKACLVSGFH